MAWTELIERRGQKEKHYYDPDTDKYRAVFSIHDQHFKDDFDDWIDVDESIVDDTGGFDKKCDTTRHIFQIASGGNRRWYPRRDEAEYVDITGIQYWTGNQWRNLNLPAAVWKSNGAEWDMANLYASIKNTWRQIKTDFILKDNTAYTRIRFAVSFTGLTYNHDTGELTSTTDGLVWGYIQKPTAKDANDADVSVTSTYDGTYIEWSVDTTGATFPIDVDPTFTDGYGGDVETAKDNPLVSASPANNHGTRTYLWTSASTRAIFEFDLSSISSSATCDDAKVYFYKLTALGTSDWTCTLYSIKVENGGWIEGTRNNTQALEDESCWNAKQADGAGGVKTAWHGSSGLSTADEDYNSTSIGSFSGNGADVAGTEYIGDLTDSVVETWFGDGNSNYGILGIMGGTNSGQIASSDHATTGYHPKLVVEYSEGECDTIVVMEVNTVVSVNTVVGMEG